MRLTAAALAVAAAAALAPPPCHAQTDRWLLKGRALAVLPDDDSETVGGTGTKVAVDRSLGAELALAYRYRPPLALELAATFTSLDLATAGGQAPGLDAGSVDLVSASLALQYHFPGASRFHPYLGIGTVFGHLSGYSITPDLLAAGITDITYSEIVRLFTQAGVDLEIGRGWLLNAEVRYAPMTTQMTLITTAGTTLDKVSLEINPLLVGVGLARSF